MALRLRTRLLAVAFLTGGGGLSSATAQEVRAELSATYLGLNQPAVVQADGGKPAGANTFRYVWPDRDKWLERAGRSAELRAAVNAAAGDKGNPAVGVLNWEVPPTEFGTAGMDRNFRTFCAEAPVRVVAGNTYRFEVLHPDTPAAFALADNAAGQGESLRRAAYIREMYGRYYVDSLNDPRAAMAFQIALWEIIHENAWPEGQPAPLDLSGGAFRAADKQDNPEAVALARDYLKSLTGNDNVFYQNERLASHELVWMKGLVSPQAANDFAQSQFALQIVRGGGAAGGPGGAAPGGIGGGFGAPGGFGGGGFGAPGGFGGGGFGGALGGTSGGGTGSTPPVTTVPPSVINGPPGSPPGNTTTPPPSQPPINVPPVNEPPVDVPNNPVPAPAGLVLGLIAVGVFAGRKALVRASAQK